MTGGRVDSRDPQLAEVSFLGASIAKRVRAAAKQRLFHRSRQLAATASITLGPFEESLLRLMSSRTGSSTHRKIPGLKGFGFEFPTQVPPISPTMFYPAEWKRETLT